MNIVIIEDETIAAERLLIALKKIDDTVNLLAQPDSIASSVAFFKSNKETVDLIFSDIQLSDGLSFEIFSKIDIKTPVIFTTAYDEYALKAFKLASVDYLLKPLKMDDLTLAIEKFKTHFKKEQSDSASPHLLQDTYQKIQQKRLLIRYGQTIKAIDLMDAAYFYTKQKTSFMCLKNGEVLPVDETLDELERIVDPKRFFRINRQFIVCFEAIDSMFSSTKSRVKIILKPVCEEETIVSAERASDFKQWLLGKE